MAFKKVVAYGLYARSVVIGKQAGEFRCRLNVAGIPKPEADYFTNDRADAEGTALHMLGIKVSDNLVRCVQQAWSAIAEEGGGVDTNADAIELTLDADRLTYLGAAGVAANEELKKLDTAFGQPATSAALALKVRLV
jgi:hypothetical protein